MRVVLFDVDSEKRRNFYPRLKAAKFDVAATGPSEVGDAVEFVAKYAN